MNYDALFRALGWALAHSLWLATGVFLLLLIILPRIKKAHARYWVSYGGLLSLFFAVTGVFVHYYEPVSLVDASSNLSEATEFAIFFDAAALPVAGAWDRFSAWLEINHALVVMVWMIGFLFFMLRLSGGFWQVYRLRTRGVQLPESVWIERLERLRVTIGFNQRVQLLESALAHTPMAMGWIKPVILLPIGLVNQLSAAEVEAVLAHELAHIARRDWLFNLLQAFIESLFYYHPAVWWISTTIRRERENCCDDVALNATGNPIAFAKALVQVQERAIPVPALALGLSGNRRRPLLDRVRRILNQPQQQHQAMEKITATVILLALLAFVGLRANSVPAIEAAFSQISDIPTYLFGNDDDQMEADSLPKPKNTRKITREDDNEKVEAEYREGKLVRLSINGKEIPEAEFEEHEALIDELEVIDNPPTPPFPPLAPMAPMAPMPPMAPGSAFGYYFSDDSPALAPGAPIRVRSDKDGEGNTVVILENEGNPTEIVVKGKEVYINGKKMEKGETVEVEGLRLIDGDGIFGSEGQGLRYNYYLDEARAREMAEVMKLSGKELEQAQKELERELKESYKQQQLDMKRAQKEWELSAKEWEKEQKKWEKEQKKWEKEQKKWEAEQRAFEAKHKAMEEVLKKELLKDGLITDPNDFSMKINDKEMKVNKKKLSEEMRQKYIKIMEEMTGQKLNGKGSFFYNYNSDDDN
ncbi:MAG: M56 family metallopeptidase [Saprospiraceae bacterium]|nr:M56 family metallopeptidase [Saprospiraceae bacterium]